MDSEEYTVNLETYPTKDTNDSHENGSLTVIWRDYDNIIKNNPKMVYVSSVNPNEIKGPHIHTKRNSYFSCIHGNVIFIIKNDDGSYSEIESNPENGVMVFVPKNVPSAHVNISDGISSSPGVSPTNDIYPSIELVWFTLASINWEKALANLASDSAKTVLFIAPAK